MEIYNNQSNINAAICPSPHEPKKVLSFGCGKFTLIDFLNNENYEKLCKILGETGNEDQEQFTREPYGCKTMKDLIVWLREEVLNNVQWESFSALIAEGMYAKNEKYFKKVLKIVG